MANRYAQHLHSSDGIVPSVPSNYPPLFPWLVGRTSALVHVPAWRLLGPAEAITLSFRGGRRLSAMAVPGTRPASPGAESDGAAVLLAAREGV